MSDLATDSLGYTEANKVSLTERRKNYEAWVQSNRRIPMGNGHARTDERPTAQALAEKRARAEAEAKSHLINPIPEGAVCRTDEGTGDGNPSDEVRLGLAKILLSKAEGSDPAQAERLANATSALLKPIIRTDDDENLKNKVIGQGPVKKGSSPGAATAKDEDEEEPDHEKVRKVKDDDEGKEPTLREVMDALTSLGKRMDTFEKKSEDDDEDEESKDSGSEDFPERGAPKEKGEGAPRTLAADADIANHKKAMRWRKKMDELGDCLCRPDTSDLFLTFQARADKAYSVWGMRAEAPLNNEKLVNYRRRLLLPLQKHSRAFKLADLRVVAVDAAAFKTAENEIYDSAVAAGTRNDNVPVGFLRETTETRGGHQYTKFYGQPKAWMTAFAPPGKRIKRIIERNDSNGPGRTLYERE